MKILFACGGTAGHINPALAVADELCSRFPDTEVLFAGNPHGMEARLTQQAGYPFAPIEVAGIQRKLTVKNIMRNANAAYLLLKCGRRAKKIIEDFSPDVVMGTGGYVSGPIVRKAHQMGIKTLSHEQNAFPGVTTKLLAPDVDVLMLAVAGAKKYFDEKILTKTVVVGNPVREGVFTTDRESARIRLGIGKKLCIVSFGGSLGATKINLAVADLIKSNYQKGCIHHIHATGKFDYEDFMGWMRDAQIDTQADPDLDIREYIDNMPVCLAAADIIICRSGAITLSEIQCAGKASILIPSPNVAENHQYYNALEMVNRDAAFMLEEKNLSGEALIKKVSELSENPKRLSAVGENARQMAITDTAKRIADKLLEMV